jgi:beta-mannosidase
MAPSPDLLATTTWECTHLPPGSVSSPDGLPDDPGAWIPALVPGTAVAALRAAGRWAWTDDDQELMDGRDWWFRGRVSAPSGLGPCELELGGLATIADVWVDGIPVLHSENMFLTHRLSLDGPEPPTEIVIRCAALDPWLAKRRPRPRWRSQLVRTQNLRWVRTTPLGRIPGWSFSAAPVGPWRPVRLRAVGPESRVVSQVLRPRIVGSTGELDVRVQVAGPDPGRCSVTVGDHQGHLTVAADADADGYVATGTVVVPYVDRWWPHTHGAPARYAVTLTTAAGETSLGSVGFRTVEVDQAGDGFQLVVNGQPIFARGACWVPPDATGLVADAAQVRASLSAMRDGGMNMVRVGGYTTYEDEVFWDACDELGIMVWQDCMLASLDPPEDEEFLAGLRIEVTQVLGALRARPSLTVVSGSSEIHQQAAMFGIPLDQITSTAIDVMIPEVVAELLPDIPYLASSPTGGDLPFDVSKGVGHYFGVGAYQRPVTDAQLVGVRFAAECLSFATPPEPVTLERYFGSPVVAGHHPRWKRGVARDSNTSWDFEDVRDYYVGQLFGVDPYRVRYEDPARALDLGRAVVAELMVQVIGGWRRRSSGCAGALILDWQDVYPGAGWGLLDVDGRAKAPWYALARAMAPVAVLFSDDGLSGLGVHVFNDGPDPIEAELTLRLFNPFGDVAEDVSMQVKVDGHGEHDVSAARMLNGFRDLTHAYRFGPPGFDVVMVELRIGGALVSYDVFLPAGRGRPVETDLGLGAVARRVVDAETGAQTWQLEVSTRRFAQWARVDIPGFTPADSWFHLAPGMHRSVPLGSSDNDRRPHGHLRALNSAASVPVIVE